MKSPLPQSVLKSSGVAVRQIKSPRKDKVMSNKMQKLLEEMSYELQKKNTRTNVKVDTLIRKYRRYSLYSLTNTPDDSAHLSLPQLFVFPILLD